MAMATAANIFTPKTLLPSPTPSILPLLHHLPSRLLRFNSLTRTSARSSSLKLSARSATDSDYSSRRSSSNEQRETIMLPGCDYNHWLIVMEFPKDPAPTREQMIDTYLNTLASVLGRYSLSLLHSTLKLFVVSKENIHWFCLFWRNMVFLSYFNWRVYWRFCFYAMKVLSSNWSLTLFVSLEIDCCSWKILFLNVNLRSSSYNVHIVKVWRFLLLSSTSEHGDILCCE